MSWLLDHIPWWAWVVAVVGGLAASAPWWLPFWVGLPKPVKAALIAIGGGITAYLAGRNAGADAAKQRDRERDAKALKTRLEVENDIRGMPKPDRDRALDKWMRDK